MTGYLISPWYAWHTIKTHSSTPPHSPHLHTFGPTLTSTFQMSLLCVSCLRSSAHLVVLVRYFTGLTQSVNAGAIPLWGPQRGSGEPGATSSSSFSSSPAWQRLCWLVEWKTLRASYSLNVNSVAQLLDMRACREPGSQKWYQKHSSAFIRLFPLS